MSTDADGVGDCDADKDGGGGDDGDVGTASSDEDEDEGWLPYVLFLVISSSLGNGLILSNSENDT